MHWLRTWRGDGWDGFTTGSAKCCTSLSGMHQSLRRPFVVLLVVCALLGLAGGRVALHGKLPTEGYGLLMAQHNIQQSCTCRMLYVAIAIAFRGTSAVQRPLVPIPQATAGSSPAQVRRKAAASCAVHQIVARALRGCTALQHSRSVADGRESGKWRGTPDQVDHQAGHASRRAPRRRPWPRPPRTAALARMTFNINILKAALSCKEEVAKQLLHNPTVETQQIITAKRADSVISPRRASSAGCRGPG